MNHLRYKNYIGSIEYSKEDGLLYGKVMGIKSLISYEGKTGKALEKDFHEAIDFYIDDCLSNGVDPEKAYKGSFNVRIPEKLHMAVALKAQELNTSLNNFVKESLMVRLSEMDRRVENPMKEVSVKKGTKVTTRAKKKKVKASR